MAKYTITVDLDTIQDRIVTEKALLTGSTAEKVLKKLFKEMVLEGQVQQWLKETADAKVAALTPTEVITKLEAAGV